MKRTTLYGTHIALGGKMVEFAGWDMPLNYPPGILAEHLATRKFGGVFDISHMGRFSIRGADALAFLQRILTSNARALGPGQAQYTIIPSETGGALDDAYLYRIDQDEYWLVVNAANTEKDWEWLQRHCIEFADLEMGDITGSVLMLSVQGPLSKELLKKICVRPCLPEPGRNNSIMTEVFGARTLIARTGYAGEPIGFELFPPAEIAPDLFRALVDNGKELGIAPVGLGARDTLRLEADLPLFGHELGQDTNGVEIPVFALPLARVAVSFSPIKGDLIGREALREQFEEVKARQEGRLEAKRGLLVRRTIVPLSFLSQGVPRSGFPVYRGDTLIGNVTSGTMVPYWKFEGDGLTVQPGPESAMRAIALAYLDADLARGEQVKVLIRDKDASAVIVDRHLGLEAPPYAVPQLWHEKRKTKPLAARKLPKFAVQLVGRTAANTRWRQQDTINLIPSEQTPSPLVKLLTIADPIGRYAEHRKIAAFQDRETYYYQGTDFIQEVEEDLAEQLRDYLHCAEVEVRPISGQMANTAVFSGLLDFLNAPDRHSQPRRIRSVMMHSIGKGGHLSAQPMGALRNFVSVDPVTERWSVISFPVRVEDPYQIDVKAAGELIREHRPELIVFGKSLIIYPEPVRELVAAATDVRPRPIIMYDAAHVLGLVGPAFQEPFNEGADLITGSTHKTFFGTQRGLIASNIKDGSSLLKLWKSIERRTFPGSVSNHHLATILGLLMAVYEMAAYRATYQAQVMANARAFAAALKEKGLHVEGDPAFGFTKTHQVIVRVGYAKGMQVAAQLEKNNVIVNYQALPDDEGFSASSGLRMGVQEMTRFGMKEADFAEVAGYIADVVLAGKDVSRTVSSFRKRFRTMQYCLPEEEARPLIKKLLDNLL